MVDALREKLAEVRAVAEEADALLAPFAGDGRGPALVLARLLLTAEACRARLRRAVDRLAAAGRGAPADPNLFSRRGSAD